MRIKSSLRTGLLALTFVFVASCAGESGQSDIPSQDPDEVAAGAELYEANCAGCHGSDLRGTDRGPSHLSEVYEPSHHGDGAFQVAILAGSPQHHWDFGAMPPVEGLDSPTSMRSRPSSESDSGRKASRPTRLAERASLARFPRVSPISLSARI